MKMLAVILTSLLSAPAFAGIIIGNGGIGLDCGPDKPVQLLDIWEAQEIKYKLPDRAKLTLNDPAGTTAHEKFFSLMMKVRARFPELADLITREYALFETKSVPVENFALEDPPNSLISVKPYGCTVKTIVLAQPRPYFRRTPRYLRAEDIFDKRMTPLHQMYTGFHESVQAVGLAHGVEHALGVRQVMALMAANEWEFITDNEWIEAFREARIPFYEAAGFRIPLFSGEMRPCDLPVGSINCVPQAPTWKETRVEYDDERLSEVSFGGTAGEIEIRGGDAISVKAVAKNFKFEREGGELKIAFSGTMEFGTSLASSAEKKVAFEGRIQPSTGYIEGVQVAADVGRKPLVGSIASVYADVPRAESPIIQSER